LAVDSLYSIEEIQKLIEDAKKIAIELFNLDVKIELDDSTDDGSSGHYDFYQDRVFIHLKFIEWLSSQYSEFDLKEFIYHTVSHEIGHAYQARLFENCSVFPYTLRISSNSKTTFDSIPMSTREFSNEFNYFINSIFDYSVDLRLFENGLSDQTAKKRVVKILSRTTKVKDPKEQLRKKIETFFDLPTQIHDYKFGTITPLERDKLIESGFEIVGKELWNHTLELLNCLSLGNEKNYPEVVSKLLDTLFIVDSRWKKMSKKSISTVLPPFWNKSSYYVLFLEK